MEVPALAPRFTFRARVQETPPPRRISRETGTLMAATSLTELEEQIAEVRDNIRELTEQAAALSGAGDEALAADRIAEQELQLAELLKKREALLK